MTMNPHTAGRAMAAALIECRNEGIITAEEFAATKARSSKLDGGWATPQEERAERALVESFTEAMERLDK